MKLSKRTKSVRASRKPHRFHLESVEPRVLCSAYTVTSIADGGTGSLRQAILSANAHAGADTIAFNIGGLTVHTITPATALPAITDALTINGITQPGSAANTAAFGAPSTAVLKVVLDGATAHGTGLNVTAANVTIRGLIFQRFATAIAISGNNAVIAGNLIGVTSSGTASATLGNTTGIAVGGDPANASLTPVSAVRIGGTIAADRNVIGGYTTGSGIQLAHTRLTRMQGNYIGTTSSGATAAGPGSAGGSAVLILGDSDGDTIGGPTSAAGNVLSASHYGIWADAESNLTISNNRVGTNAAGTAALANADGIGFMDPVYASTATVNGNLVSGNLGWGIWMGGDWGGVSMVSNKVGTDITGLHRLGNGSDGIFIDTGCDSDTISGDLISANRGNGIVIRAAQVTVDTSRIGTDVNGTLPLGNALNGILIDGQIGGPPEAPEPSAQNITIGGPNAATANVICANGADGIRARQTTFGDIAYSYLSANTVQFNFIGTNAAGTLHLGNVGNGIHTQTEGQLNIQSCVISGNLGNGIWLETEFSDAAALGAYVDNAIYSSVIGAAPDGTTPLPNGGAGILIDSGGNVIGSIPDSFQDRPGDLGGGNIIAFNTGAGVAVSSGVINTIRGNSIYSNGGLGIDLNNDGVTANHAVGSIVSGPNNFQNAPVITRASFVGRTLVVSGQINSNSPGSSGFDIDVYTSSSPDPSRHGEGQTYIGTVYVPFSASGHAIFNLPVVPALTGQTYISATATALPPDNGQLGPVTGDTSEFSNTWSIAPSLLAPPILRIAKPLPWFPGPGPGPTGSTKLPTIVLQFSQDVSQSLSGKSIFLTNIATKKIYFVSALAYDHKTNIATLTFPVPTGNYNLTVLSSQIVNYNGVALNNGKTVNLAIAFSPLKGS